MDTTQIQYGNDPMASTVPAQKQDEQSQEAQNEDEKFQDDNDESLPASRDGSSPSDESFSFSHAASSQTPRRSFSSHDSSPRAMLSSKHNKTPDTNPCPRPLEDDPFDSANIANHRLAPPVTINPSNNSHPHYHRHHSLSPTIIKQPSISMNSLILQPDQIRKNMEKLLEDNPVSDVDFMNQHLVSDGNINKLYRKVYEGDKYGNVLTKLAHGGPYYSRLAFLQQRYESSKYGQEHGEKPPKWAFQDEQNLWIRIRSDGGVVGIPKTQEEVLIEEARKAYEEHDRLFKDNMKAMAAGPDCNSCEKRPWPIDPPERSRPASPYFYGFTPSSPLDVQPNLGAGPFWQIEQANQGPFVQDLDFDIDPNIFFGTDLGWPDITPTRSNTSQRGRTIERALGIVTGTPTRSSQPGRGGVDLGNQNISPPATIGLGLSGYGELEVGLGRNRRGAISQPSGPTSSSGSSFQVSSTDATISEGDPMEE